MRIDPKPSQKKHKIYGVLSGNFIEDICFCKDLNHLKLIPWYELYTKNDFDEPDSKKFEFCLIKIFAFYLQKFGIIIFLWNQRNAFNCKNILKFNIFAVNLI